MARAPTRCATAALLLSALGCGGGQHAAPISSPAPLTATVQVGSGLAGRLDLAMSTSFQPAEWDDTTFESLPGAATALGSLVPRHIRLQAVSKGVPETGPESWDFTTVDAITQVVLSVGDRSPEFQIAVAPPFMRDSTGAFTDPSFREFAGYASDLVRYYNTGGFRAGDGRHVSPSGTPITWWGIFNEPNGNGVSATDYTRMYNVVVPQMQAVDPSLRFMALELSDYGDQEQQFVPPFVNGVKARVDALATHFYSSCNQRDLDQQIFATVPSFGAGVGYIRTELMGNPRLGSVPVLVTENNVNADFSGAGGESVCNPGETFVTDLRGSSAFFAAWRPLVFSTLGKAGAQALYHWLFAGDAQYGEIDDATGLPRLSYWVDYHLARMFPSPPGADILDSSASDPELEALAARNPDGSVVVMVVNHAVAQPGDNNGPGRPCSVTIDVSALGPFASASLLTIDARTDPAAGPSPTALGFAPSVTVGLSGYGVAFLSLR